MFPMIPMAQISLLSNRKTEAGIVTSTQIPVSLQALAICLIHQECFVVDMLKSYIYIYFNFQTTTPELSLKCLMKMGPTTSMLLTSRWVQWCIQWCLLTHWIVIAVILNIMLIVGVWKIWSLYCGTRYVNAHTWPHDIVEAYHTPYIELEWRWLSLHIATISEWVLYVSTVKVFVIWKMQHHSSHMNTCCKVRTMPHCV